MSQRKQGRAWRRDVVASAAVSLLAAGAGCVALTHSGSRQSALTGSGGVVLSSALTTTYSPRPANPITWSDLPLHFETNNGQFAAGVEFLARAQDYTVFLTTKEIVLAPGHGLRSGESAPVPAAAASLLRIRPLGVDLRKPTGLDRLPGRAHYFMGRDPRHWVTDVPMYAGVKYEGAYPGIDLVYHGDGRRLRFDLLLAPGADLGHVRFEYCGAASIQLDADANLVLQTPAGRLIQYVPTVYQEGNGTRHPIGAEYRVESLQNGGEHGTPDGDGADASAAASTRAGCAIVGIRVAAYDRAKPLIVDPVIAYSTYLDASPPSNWTGPYSIVVDAAGAAYVTGAVLSSGLPVATGLQTAFAGGVSDAFVMKLNPAGSAIDYATYLGGSGDD